MMKNQNLPPKQKAINGGGEQQQTVTTPELSQLSWEELNKVSGGAVGINTNNYAESELEEV